MRARIRRTASAGFSLVEMAVTSVLLTMLLGGVAIVGQTNVKTFQLTATQRRSDVAVQRAVQRAASELKFSGAERVSPDPAAGFENRIQFDQVVDIVAGAAVWGPVMSIDFEYDPGEMDDGADNDGDGLVDEGRVVLTRNVGGVTPTRIVLSRNVREYLEGETPNGVDDNGNGLVDEPGFCITRAGDMIGLRLTVEGMDPNNQVFERTVETSVRMRNSLP